MKTNVVLGIIGGTGVYQMKGVSTIKEHALSTPYGNPSDVVIEAEVAGKRAFFLPRHGRGHRLLPSEVNYRANIYALKMLGVTHVFGVSAVGIMVPYIQPGDFVIPDQLFDFTRGTRKSSFLGEGLVGHVSLADPFCENWGGVIQKAANDMGAKIHRGGTYVCIEGPQFSSRAESHFFRETIKPVVIGMTACPEVKLAREAELCYGLMCLATDYDCWHEEEEDVSSEGVLEVLKKNSAKANEVVQEVIRQAPIQSSCAHLEAMKHGFLTDPQFIPVETRRNLRPLYGKYIDG